MLTSLDRPGESGRLLEIGFNAYLIKPVRRRELQACVASALGHDAFDRTGKFQPLITRGTLALSARRRYSARILITGDVMTIRLDIIGPAAAILLAACAVPEPRTEAERQQERAESRADSAREVADAHKSANKEVQDARDALREAEDDAQKRSAKAEEGQLRESEARTRAAGAPAVARDRIKRLKRKRATRPLGRTAIRCLLRAPVTLHCRRRCKAGTRFTASSVVRPEPQVIFGSMHAPARRVPENRRRADAQG